MSFDAALNRRSLLARSAAIAAVPAVASLAGGALAEPASADALPDVAAIPPSALGPPVKRAREKHLGRGPGLQAAQVDYAAAPVIKKYTGVLAAVDVYTASTAFILLESIRLDRGFDLQIHP
jgi:hypothetical protein